MIQTQGFNAKIEWKRIPTILVKKWHLDTH